jgi:hypothetical protein
MPKRKPRPESPAPESPPESPSEAPEREVEEVEETEDTRDVLNIDGALTDYIAQENLDDSSYRASLYQYDKVNKNKQALLDVQIGAIFSPHDVGMAYGSGEYRYVVTWPKYTDPVTHRPRIKAFRFNIGQSYDLKRALVNPPPLPGPQSPPGPAPDPIGQAMQIVGALVQLQRTATPPPAPAPQDPVLEMTKMHAAMQQILMQSSMQYVEFMKDMRRRFTDMESGDYEPEEEGDEEMEEDALVAQIKELAIEYLPKILGDGLGAKAATAAIRAAPQFRKVVKDGPKLSHLLDELEKEFGREKVDAACERLKVKRPISAPAS